LVRERAPGLSATEGCALAFPQISQQTIDAVQAHADFCNAGIDCLVRNDPDAQIEMTHIDNMRDCLESDLLCAIQYLTEEEQDNFIDQVEQERGSSFPCSQDLDYLMEIASTVA
jgi:hypothetical protein